MITDGSQVLYGGHMDRIHLYGSKLSSSIFTKAAPSGEDFEESFFVIFWKTIKTKGFHIATALINENLYCYDGTTHEKIPLIMLLDLF